MAAARPNSGSGVKTDNRCKGKLEARTILQTEEDYYPSDNRIKLHYRNYFTSLKDNRQRICELVSYGISFFSALFVWRSWERVKPAASTTARLCLWFCAHTKTCKVACPLRSTEQGLRMILGFGVQGKVVKLCEITSIQFAKAGIIPWATSLSFTISAGHKLPSVYRHSSCAHMTKQK